MVSNQTCIYSYSKAPDASMRIQRCPGCRRDVIVSKDGRFRKHRSDPPEEYRYRSRSEEPASWACKGSLTAPVDGACTVCGRVGTAVLGNGLLRTHTPRNGPRVNSKPPRGYPNAALPKLIESVAAHPDWNLTQHAAAIGVSRERVRQLGNEHPEIGVKSNRVLRRERRLLRERTQPRCQYCGSPQGTRKNVDCVSCVAKARVLHFTCYGCGIEFDRPYSLRFMSSRRTDPEESRPFHNRACWLAWMKRAGSDYWRPSTVVDDTIGRHRLPREMMTTTCEGCGGTITYARSRTSPKVPRFHLECFRSRGGERRGRMVG